MIEEQGRVVAIDADRAWIEMRRAGACGACASKQGCGAANLARLFGDRYTRVQVANTLGLRTGDEVVLGVPEHALLRGAAWLYGLPLALFIVGAVVGELSARAWSLSSDSAAALFAFGGLMLGLWMARRWSQRAPKTGQFQPVVLRTVTSGSEQRVACAGDRAETDSQRG